MAFSKEIVIFDNYNMPGFELLDLVYMLQVPNTLLQYGPVYIRMMNNTTQNSLADWMKFEPMAAARCE